jgi:GAF domain-containing protein
MSMTQQAERAALINRISQAVRRTLDVSEVFQTAVHELGEHLGVDRCSLYMKMKQPGASPTPRSFMCPTLNRPGQILTCRASSS